jgi:hypothetical protein
MEDKLSIEEAHRLIQEAWDSGDPPPVSCVMSRSNVEYFVSKLCKSKRKRQRKKWVAQRFVRVVI